jgi:hypothetical protein
MELLMQFLQPPTASTLLGISVTPDSIYSTAIIHLLLKNVYENANNYNLALQLLTRTMSLNSH